ncbi:MAG: hypothetical protein HYV63_19075 [Candidatus Schekmanbacteria bacterium]|nr:hypothetical protein [Candidatus Schekmanbacteria bacterium]
MGYGEVSAAARAGFGAGDAPPLPPGLLDQDEPALPAGLGDGDEPVLPTGLDGTAERAAEDTAEEAPAEAAAWPVALSGFLEVRMGARVHDDPYEKRLSLAEARARGVIEKSGSAVTVRAAADLLYDHLEDSLDLDLEAGSGWLDLREAFVAARPAGPVDAKLGRQILTWGTGDLLFVNDLFPKDWRAFLLGRDVEYLKAPSDAAKLSLFTPAANLDVIYTPRFDADRGITGRRLSYYDAALARLAGRDAIIVADVPDRWFRDSETAARLYRTVAGYELALYGYLGYWKSPAGFDPGSGHATHPRLRVYGASARGVLGRGIASAELGYFASPDDVAGTDFAVRNGELRVLCGYEQELVRNVTLGVQYYLEHMRNHDQYRETLPPGQPGMDADRHVLTTRVTALLRGQNLRLTLFGFYSPSDDDGYVRPEASYRITDHVQVTGGANVFAGAHDHTFFGQLENNTNVHVGMRYSY